MERKIILQSTMSQYHYQKTHQLLNWKQELLINLRVELFMKDNGEAHKGKV